jgi:hypothetical protein
MALQCNSIIVPPANCSGHGTLVPANCTCACFEGFANDLTVGAGEGGVLCVHHGCAKASPA